MVSLNSILLSWFISTVTCECSIWIHLMEIKKVKTFTSIEMLYTASFWASHCEVTQVIALGQCGKAVGIWVMVPSHQSHLLLVRKCSVWSVCYRLRWILLLIYTSVVTLILCIARCYSNGSMLFLSPRKNVHSPAIPIVCAVKRQKWVDLTVSHLNFLWISWVDNLEEQIISVFFFSAFFFWLAA